jgi:hypothetical protein
MVMFGGSCNGGTNCRRVIDLDLQRLGERRDRTQAHSGWSWVWIWALFACQRNGRLKLGVSLTSEI